MRKIYLFIFSLIIFVSVFTFKVNAANEPIYLRDLTMQETSSHFIVHATIRVAGEDEFDLEDYYFLDFSYLFSYYRASYDEVSVSIQYGKESTGDKKALVANYYHYEQDKEGVKIQFCLEEEAYLYYVDLDYDMFDRRVSGQMLPSYVYIRSYNATIPQSIPNVFSTAASITMSPSSGKGTVNGSISFSTNTYANGWYCLDLNYVKELYGFKVNISSANFSCSTNSNLNTVLHDSVAIDAQGNVVYFPLPNLNNVTDTINYVIIFGSGETGSTINDVGSKVKITKLTSNTSTQALAFSSENYSYKVSVDNPPSIVQLISQISLSAVDNYSGNVNVVYTDSNSYESSVVNKQSVASRSLGEYNISFNASDTKNNANSLGIKVIVEDKTSPVINTSSSTLSYERGYADSILSDETLKSGIVATDNYASSDSLIIGVQSNVYKASYNQVGSYTIPVSVADPSGNTSQTQIIVRVKDNVPPVFSGSNTFSTSYTSDITATEIIEKCGVVATDAIDQELDIIIASDTYSPNKYTPGNYTIVVRATDDEGNFAEFSINVTVTDNITPYFLVNKTTLIVENGYAYTPEQILESAISSGLIRTDYEDIEVIEDEYTDNKDKEGTYLYRLRVTYADGEEYVDINLKVINQTKDVVKLKWYVRIGHFFANVFHKVGHFFSDIVYEKGIKKVFNFVKNIWNKVFRR